MKYIKRLILLITLFLMTFVSCLNTSSAQETKPNWPRQISSALGQITLYQPQVSALEGNTLTGKTAVSIAPKNGSAPVFGAVWFSAQIVTSLDSRTYTLSSVNITQSKFPNVDKSLSDQISQSISQEVPSLNMTLSLDQLLASLKTAKTQQKDANNLSTAPPTIIFSQTPAVLVSIQGTPQLQPVPDTKVMRVMNTPFLIAFDPAKKLYYLWIGGQWLSATDIQGNWEITSSVPPSVQKLASSKSTNAATQAGFYQSSNLPRVIVATSPTELIVTDGVPDYATIQSTSLLYVSNTTSDVFLDIDNQINYVLLSGRWYKSPSLSGPWIYVAANALPQDFTLIPENSPKANALVSVAGSPQAKDAVLTSSIPSTAQVKPNAKPQNPVTYAGGQPEFKPIETTPLQYAVNTSSQVIMENPNSYYLCAEGIWYHSQTSLGPWVVATSVPQVIYTIPPSSPVYSATYCYVYAATPDYVTVGYLPGYTGSYVYGGTVVYGTGWVYPPYVGVGVCYPAPSTFGFSVGYSNGQWAFGVGYSSGFGSACFAWGGGSWNNNNWWGHGGYQQNNININNNINNSFNKNSGNIYNRNTSNLINNGKINNQQAKNDWNNVKNNPQAQKDWNNAKNNPQAQKDWNNVKNNPQAQKDWNNAKNNPQAKNDYQNAKNDYQNHSTNDPGKNNVFADDKGNVYKHTPDGWQQHAGGQWKNAQGQDFDRQHQQLNNDYRARSSGYSGSRGGGFRGRR